MEGNFTQKLDILFESEDLIAINKPHGLLVHRTKLAVDAKQFALQQLRDQLGVKVYPLHRLDRKTAGVLLFAKNEPANKWGQQLFRERLVKKKYLAIVRGFTKPSATIDYPLTNNSKSQEAITHYLTLKQFEIPIPSAGFATSRYSLIELHPETGRFHQLRKHMAHIFHPILGDRPHGCNKQNKLWKERFGMTTLLLHAQQLELTAPNGQSVSILAPLSPVFQSVLNQLNSTSTI